MTATDEDRYRKMFYDLFQRMNQTDPDEHLKKIVRQEVDKRILGLGVFALGLWAMATFGWFGVASAVGLGLLWFFILDRIDDLDPKCQAFRIPDEAEDLVRLQIVTETAQANEDVWAIEEKQYERDKRKVVPVLNERWDRFWERSYNVALELEKLSPRARRKRISLTAKMGKDALLQAKQLSNREEANLASWTATALHKLERD